MSASKQPGEMSNGPSGEMPSEGPRERLSGQPVEQPPERPSDRPQVYRLFLAVAFPAAVRRQFFEAATAARVPGAKVVAAENIHLTLKFLGNCAVDRVDAVRAAAAEAAAAHSPYDMVFGDFGAFPTPRRPRVVWIGLTEGGQETQALRADIEDAMVALGFPADERFDPHVTVARIKRPRVVSDDALPAATDWDHQGFRVEAVSLYRSVLRPQGPIYTELARLPLGSLM